MEKSYIEEIPEGKCYYNERYELHREDGPAIEFNDGTEGEYYLFNHYLPKDTYDKILGLIQNS